MNTKYESKNVYQLTHVNKITKLNDQYFNNYTSEIANKSKNKTIESKQTEIQRQRTKTSELKQMEISTNFSNGIRTKSCNKNNKTMIYISKNSSNEDSENLSKLAEELLSLSNKENEVELPRGPINKKDFIGKCIPFFNINEELEKNKNETKIKKNIGTGTIQKYQVKLYTSPLIKLNINKNPINSNTNTYNTTLNSNNKEDKKSYNIKNNSYYDELKMYSRNNFEHKEDNIKNYSSLLTKYNLHDNENNKKYHQKYKIKSDFISNINSNANINSISNIATVNNIKNNALKNNIQQNTYNSINLNKLKNINNQINNKNNIVKKNETNTNECYLIYKNNNDFNTKISIKRKKYIKNDDNSKNDSSLKNAFLHKTNSNLFQIKSQYLNYDYLNENKRYFNNNYSNINMPAQKEFNNVCMLSQNKSQKYLGKIKKSLASLYWDHLNKNLQCKSCNTKKHKEYSKSKNVLNQEN